MREELERHQVGPVATEQRHLEVRRVDVDGRVAPLGEQREALGDRAGEARGEVAVDAVGGLLEYNFGPASASVWATQEVLANARNAAVPVSTDGSLITQGMTVFFTLSYRLWAPEEPPKPALFHK